MNHEPRALQQAITHVVENEDRTPTERILPAACLLDPEEEKTPTIQELIGELVVFTGLAESAFKESAYQLADRDGELADRCRKAMTACGEILSHVGRRTCEPAVKG